MKRCPIRLPVCQSRSRKTPPFLLTTIFVFIIVTFSSAFAQYVPPVGPSHCVWGCGGGLSSGGTGVPTGTLGRNMNIGGLFGGIAVMLGTAILTNALTGPAAPAGNKQALPAQSKPDPRHDAIRKAIAEQQRIQEERHRSLLSNLKDLPVMELIDDPSKLSLLEGPREQLAAAAARLFDGASEPDAFWMKNHDVWFSTRGYTAQAVSPQPIPAGDQPVEYGEQQLKPLECQGPTPYGGQLCPFPNMRVSAGRLETIEVSPSGKMLAPSGSPARLETIISQFSEQKGRVLSAFRRSWSNASPTDPKIPDLITTHFFEPLQEKSLSGLQGETAKLGRGAVKNVMTSMAGHFFNQLNQALINPELAIEMGEAETVRNVIQDAMGESLPDPAKGAYLLLTERPEAAADAFKGYLKDKATDTFKDTIQDFIAPEVESASLVEKQTRVLHPDTFRWKNHQQHWLIQTKDRIH